MTMAENEFAPVAGLKEVLKCIAFVIHNPWLNQGAFGNGQDSLHHGAR